MTSSKSKEKCNNSFQILISELNIINKFIDKRLKVLKKKIIADYKRSVKMKK